MMRAILVLVSILLMIRMYPIECLNTAKPSKSGYLPWVDVDTPESELTKINSRGKIVSLVMSDEFNNPGRYFTPGNDHLWTSLELPDGVNAALQYYSHNMTTTKNEDGIGYLDIEADLAKIDIEYYNAYTHPPKYQTKTMFYRSGMIQSWNKFCLQGGVIEVNVQLPGVVTKESGNPDLRTPHNRVRSLKYYPTWPGIWLMGNLGRALFTASTNRMWPWSFDTCVPAYESSQKVNACNGNPGSGLNPYQGRGAPEIDILEGGGDGISASIQVAPGMPTKYRLTTPEKQQGDQNLYCHYSSEFLKCKTIGANAVGVPTSYWNNKGYKSWYQGMKYMPNDLCRGEREFAQTGKNVLDSLRARGVVMNDCDLNTCPASRDINGDLSRIPGTSDNYGINYNGTCMSVINSYTGTYLCDPDNSNSLCSEPYTGNTPNNNRKFGTFNYQMDALSANYGIPTSAYLTYLRYKIEWVTGPEGYIRWELNDNMIYEIPASALVDIPQDPNNPDNPVKLMVEEPMYIIFNVALSNSWGAKPPNPNGQCFTANEGDNIVCRGFPLHLKVDYIRVWQDETMSVGCDPSSHPTAQYIADNIDDYTNEENRWVPVSGLASCRVDDDCTADIGSRFATGKCTRNRCQCNSISFSGPRCTFPLGLSATTSSSFGPSFGLAIGLSTAIIVVTICIILYQQFYTEKFIRRGVEPDSCKSHDDSEMVSIKLSKFQRSMI